MESASGQTGAPSLRQTVTGAAPSFAHEQQPVFRPGLARTNLPAEPATDLPGGGGSGRPFHLSGDGLHHLRQSHHTGRHPRFDRRHPPVGSRLEHYLPGRGGAFDTHGPAQQLPLCPGSRNGLERRGVPPPGRPVATHLGPGHDGGLPAGPHYSDSGADPVSGKP